MQSYASPSISSPNLTGALLFFALAIGGAIGIALSSEKPLLGVALSGGLCILVPLCLRPEFPVAGLLLALLLIDEFPSGLGETVERSTRTPFYSKSLGLPGLYGPDALLFLALGVYLAHLLVRRRGLRIKIDPIAIALLLLALTGAFAVVVSMVFENPLTDVVIQKSTGVGFNVNERGLQYIAAFQFKIFYMLFAAYLLGRYFFAEPHSVDWFCKLFFLAAVISIGIGIGRLALNPKIVTTMSPLFYDSPSTWIFALFIFYVVGSWAYGILDSRRALLLFAVSAVLGVFILISFRRTMWAACGIAALIMLVMLPSKARGRVLALGISAVTLAGVALLMSPMGGSLVGSVVGRVEQTNIQDASTLYRLAIYTHMAQTYDEIPVFGYGLAPLWNHTASLGYFQTNLENVHSMYFWWWLRTGLFGIVVGIFAGAIILWQNFQIWRRSRTVEAKLLALCALLAWEIMAFSGLFNPVYGEVRYVVLAGFGLALLSRLRADAYAPRSPDTGVTVATS